MANRCGTEERLAICKRAVPAAFFRTIPHKNSSETFGTTRNRSRGQNRTSPFIYTVKDTSSRTVPKVRKWLQLPPPPPSRLPARWCPPKHTVRRRAEWAAHASALDAAIGANLGTSSPQWTSSRFHSRRPPKEDLPRDRRFRHGADLPWNQSGRRAGLPGHSELLPRREQAS
jgi:hypothetical protein